MVNRRSYLFRVLVQFFFAVLVLDESISRAEETIEQTTTGDRSPSVVGESVVIHYHGLSRKEIGDLLHTIQLGFKEDREGKDDADFRDNIVSSLIDILKRKDVASEELSAKIREILEKHKTLVARLEKRSSEDALIVRAKLKLKSWDLRAAEAHLEQSLAKNLSVVGAKRNAAVDAYDLGSLKEFQLKYGEAGDYYHEAAVLDPKNSEYENDRDRMRVVIESARRSWTAVLRTGFSVATGVVGVELQIDKFALCAGYFPGWSVVGGVKYYFGQREASSWYAGLVGGYRDSIGDDYRDDAFGYLVGGVGGYSWRPSGRLDVCIGGGPGVYGERIPVGGSGDAGDLRFVMVWDIAVGWVF